MNYNLLKIHHLQNLEIEITTRCNLKCLSCDRRCRQAPSDEEMSVQQLEHFVAETKSLNYKWNKINILGGEPSLHSDFLKVLEILKCINTSLVVVTNGYATAKNLEKRVPSGICVRNTQKESQINEFFVPVDVTMLENENVNTILSCDHTDCCGLGLSRYGYYPCGPGASIDRVLGFDIGIKRLSDVSFISVNDQKMLLCQYCGWSETRVKYPIPSLGYMSPFWKKNYKSYKLHKNQLHLYGNS